MYLRKVFTALLVASAVLIGGAAESSAASEHSVKKGDSLYKEPNIIHGCVCLEAGKLLDVFTPKREDFLK